MTRAARLVLLAAFVIAAVLYILALTPYIGEAYDDGRYIALAQSLAKGMGFSEIQVPGNPPESQYPPGWPLLLSTWWFIAPDFPANAFGFKLISALCALAFSAVNYGWMRWRGDGSVSSVPVTLLTLFNPLVFGLATSAFSEMAYASFSVLALWLVERYARSDSSTWRGAIVPSLVAAWAMYVRSVGIVVALAAVVFLFFQKQRRKAFVFAALCFLWMAPWFIRGALLPGNAWTYTQQFMLKSMEQPELGTVGMGELAVRVILNLRAYVLAGLPGALLPSQVPLTFVNLDGGLRVGSPFPGSDILLAVLLAGGLIGQTLFRRALVDIYVVIYLAMAMLWPWEPTRFVIPLIPFLYAYVLFEVGLFASALGRYSLPARVIRTVALAALGLFIVANIGAQARLALDVRRSVEPDVEWAARFRLYDWIKNNTPRTSVLAAINDTQVYLYTGRQTIRSVGSASALKGYGVEYIVLVPYGGVMVEGDLSRIQFDPLFRKHPTAFTPVYEDVDAGIQIFKVSLEALK